MRRPMGLFFILLAAPCAAADLRLTCGSPSGDWSLALDGARAKLTFMIETELEVMLDTPAQGREWPRALSLIGDRDTGILILDQRMCPGDPAASHTAQLLTQRGQTPVFLTGCCRPAE